MRDGLASEALSRREIARLSRLAPLDKALVLILVPLWVVCFAVSVRTQLRGGGVATFAVSVEDAESYPTLKGDTMLGPKRLAATGLRAGDRLIQLGDADLRGVGSMASREITSTR